MSDFYRSWGAGIMIFGHQQTSHGIKLTDNVFAYDGCVQNRGDKGGISIMCPGGHKPDGTISGNEFFTCPNVSAIAVNPAVPGCADNMDIVNNTMQPASNDPRQGRLVAMPQVRAVIAEFGRCVISQHDQHLPPICACSANIKLGFLCVAGVLQSARPN